MDSTMKRKAGRSMPWMARFGYVAKGVVYLLVGVLAAMAALGTRSDNPGTADAFRVLLGQPFGQVLLGLVALGLAAYSLWRMAVALRNPERRGAAHRARYALSGVMNGALVVAAVGLLLGSGGSGGEGSVDGGTATLMSQPFGRFLVAALGIGLGISGLVHFYQVYAAKFMQRLETGRMSFREERFARRAGQWGYAARGLVFLVIGGFMVAAAWNSNPSQALGLEGALQALRSQAYGAWVLGFTGVGMAAYGVSQWVQARYRRIPVMA